MTDELHTQAQCEIEDEARCPGFWDRVGDEYAGLHAAFHSWLAAWRDGENPSTAGIKSVATVILDVETNKRSAELEKDARDREDEARMEMAQERLKDDDAKRRG